MMVHHILKLVLPNVMLSVDIYKYAILYFQTFIITFIALISAHILIELGVFYYLGRLFTPIIKPLNLPPETAIPITMRMLSPTAFHSMLAALYREKVTDENEVITTIFISQLPQRLYYMLRLYIPIVLPILGPILGMYYILLSFFIAVLYTVFGLIYGRLTCKKCHESGKVLRTVNRSMVHGHEVKICRKAVETGIKNGIKTYISIAWRMAIAYILVTLLLLVNAFESISNFLTPYITHVFINPSAITISALAIFSPLTALPMAGDLYMRGIVSLKDCLTALFLGRMIFIVINDLPKATPTYFGLYGSRVGVKIFLLMEIMALIGNSLAISIVFFCL